MSCRAPRTLSTCVLVVALLIVSGAPLAAQSSGDPTVGASECCDQLHFYIGARAAALGNALTARPGSDGLFVNPAALLGVWRDEFRVHNAPTELEKSNTFALAFRIRDVGAFGVAYRLVDYGELDATDDVGNIIGKLRTLDHMLMASFATSMSAGLSGGISYKLFQFRQDCSGLCTSPGFAGTTHGIDAGLQYHPRLWPSLQLGAAVLHLGLPLQVINADQADPMPTRFRFGAAYEVLHHFSADSSNVLWLSADVSGSLRQGTETVIAAGAELVVDQTIFVRAGYSTGGGRTAGPAVGVGLRYDRFDVGIGQTFVNSATGFRNSYQVTFAVGF